MPDSLYIWLGRIKAVEREYLAARASIGHLREAVARGAHRLVGTKVGDLIRAEANLEATYLIRLWAEFETAVRSYHGWKTRDPDARIGTHDLIDAVAGVRHGRAIPDDVRRAAHIVRDYRNSLVHARDDPARPVAITDARRDLNTYLCRLPERWG